MKEILHWMHEWEQDDSARHFKLICKKCQKINFDNHWIEKNGCEKF